MTKILNARSLILIIILFSCFNKSFIYGQDFLKEDWIYTYEPTHPTGWGIQWGLRNLMLPNKILMRGKQFAENRYFNNYRFKTETGGFKGFVLRFFSFAGDYTLMFATLNWHHMMGHDAAARDMARRYALGSVREGFDQVLPVYLGGRELDDNERNDHVGGIDAHTQHLVQPMQAENHFAYEAMKSILSRQENNRSEIQLYIFYRIRFLQDGIEEDGRLSQDYIDYSLMKKKADSPNQNYGKKVSTDFTNYLIALNKDRYGIDQIEQFKLKMEDINKAYVVQLADPLFWIGLWQYGKDYFVYGKNQSSLPMLSIGKEIGYLPSIRVYLSPFGVEYYQDNYLRYKNILANFYWAKGDDAFEKRLSFGVDIDNIQLGRYLTLGTFFGYSHQPLLSRITNVSPLSPGEIGQRKIVYNYGGTIKLPVWRFDKSEDPTHLFLYGRFGRSDGWFPGEYLNSGTYAQIGLGLHI